MNRRLFALSIFFLLLAIAPAMTLLAMAAVVALILLVTGGVLWFSVIAACWRARAVIRQRDDAKASQPPQVVVKVAEEVTRLSAARNGKPPHNDLLR